MDARAVARCKYLSEHFIHSANELGRGTEIRCEWNERELKRLAHGKIETQIIHPREQFRIGIAEKVYRLHRIADNKNCPARGIGPRGDNARNEFTTFPVRFTAMPNVAAGRS